MTERSLQVTYRKGRTFAAYLHLPHATGEKSARTVASPDGLLIVDYSASGTPPSGRATLHHRVEHALTKSLGRLDLLAVPGERPDRGVHALLEREDLAVTRPCRPHHLTDPVAR